MTDERNPKSGRVRRALMRACHVALGLTVGAVVLGFWGQRSWVADLFSHFQFQYAIAFAVLTLVFGCLGAYRSALLGLVCLVVPCSRMSPLYVPSAKASSSDVSMRVVTFNVLVGNDRYLDVMHWLLEVDADVVFLCECTRDWQEALSPLESTYPHTASFGGRGGMSYQLFSKYPVKKMKQFWAGGRQPILRAVLETSIGEVTLFGVHPAPPMSEVYAERHAQYMQSLERLALEASGPTLWVGDFNSTRWSARMTRLKEIGCEDSAEGFGLQPTWMRNSVIFSIPIDQVLVRGMPPVLDRWIGPSLGSDHSPVVVDFGYYAEIM